MEVIRKVCEDNKLTLEDMKDFIFTLNEFLESFNPKITLRELIETLESGNLPLLNLLAYDEIEEYLTSVKEFLECVNDERMQIKELKQHLENTLEYLNKG